jgi:alpha-methylacyl-CoA racemase
MYAQGAWRDERGVNVLDTGAPWYDAYETKDGKWLCGRRHRGALLPEFVERLGLGADSPRPARSQRLAGAAPALRPSHQRAHARRLGAVFAGSDACVAPCCRFGEVRHHPHNARVRPSSSATASCSRHPRRAFPAPRAEVGAAPRQRVRDSEASPDVTGDSQRGGDRRPALLPA